MVVNAPGGMLRAFSQLTDPRMNRTKRHTLSDILTIALCEIICGADGWTHVAEFGRCKRRWFTTFLELPSGIPSHDTFGRVFAALARIFHTKKDTVAPVSYTHLTLPTIYSV